jgi:predicted dehydrogenase
VIHADGALGHDSESLSAAISAVTDRVRWGVLGVARIATQKVIPALQRSEAASVMAIASRDAAKARRAAADFGIPRAYGSYEELLVDADIEAIYNPLPNHLHVPWSIRAAEHGKHVLCEKPIARTADEARRLLEVRDRTGVHLQEAFMVRTHPQWLRALDIARSGRIGTVRAIAGVFSFFNRDASNIRNIADYGGGAVMDIGCYLVHTSRLIYGREPDRVMALVDVDPELHVDRLTSMLLDYGGAHTIGTCSIQMVPHQRIQILGQRGRIELLIPFNAPNDRPCRLLVDDGSNLWGEKVEVIEVPTCDQYSIQADLFSRAIRNPAAATPYPLEDSIKNMAVIDALFRSASSGRWEVPQ